MAIANDRENVRTNESAKRDLLACKAANEPRQCLRHAASYGESQRIGTIGKSGFLPGGFSRKGAKPQKRIVERKMVEKNMNGKDTKGEQFRVMACVFGFASLMVFFL